MNLDAVLAACRAGDRLAFGAIVRHYQRPLFGFLGRMGLSLSLTEDLAQEAFVRVWIQLDSFDPLRAEFSTWLFAIARNLALNEISSARYKTTETLGELESDQPVSMALPLDEALEKKQLRQRLYRAIRALPFEDRSALSLAYVQELDMRSIALIEQASESAIKTRLHRAKQKLRHLLENDDAKTS
jgi:RNA polymerase sigma-70 factor, ECF subfamily